MDVILPVDSRVPSGHIQLVEPFLIEVLPQLVARFISPERIEICAKFWNISVMIERLEKWVDQVPGCKNKGSIANRACHRMKDKIDAELRELYREIAAELPNDQQTRADADKDKERANKAMANVP